MPCFQKPLIIFFIYLFFKLLPVQVTGSSLLPIENLTVKQMENLVPSDS